MKVVEESGVFDRNDWSPPSQWQFLHITRPGLESKQLSERELATF